MDPRLFAATSQWRRQEQLRGLQPNHGGTVALEVAPLANEGALFSGCTVALHESELSVAVGMAPFLGAGPSAIGIASLSGSTATCASSGFSIAPSGGMPARGGEEDGAVRNNDLAGGMRWLDMPANAPLSSVAWVGGKRSLLLAGTSQGRILVGEQRHGAADIAAMPQQQALKVLGTLTVDASGEGMPVASCAVQPTNFAATTSVRCIKRCPMAAGANLVVGCSGGGAHLWDLEGSSPQPLLTVPVNAEEPETAVCCGWGMSSNVFAVGGIAGTSFLVDRRQGAAPAMALPSPSEYAVRSIDLSRVVPAAILVASSKGVLMVADARRPALPVVTIDALQEMPVCAQWMPHHPDLFTSAGMDGTVKLWCLRSRPSYAVGCAQFSSPIAHLTVPHSFAKPRVLGITADGQLCTTMLTKSAMLSIAPSGLKKDDAFIAAQRGVPVATPSEDAKEEQRAEGLLYCRAFKPLMKAVLGAARRREERGDLDFALRICSLIDSKTVPSMDLGQLCEQNASVSAALGALGIGGGGPAMDAPSTLLQDVALLAQRLPSTVLMSDFKGFERPDADDPIRIDALKLNITMRKLLNAREVPLVVGATLTMLSFLERRPDLVETDVLVGTTRFLLQFARRDGVTFVNKAMGLLMGKAGASGGSGGLGGADTDSGVMPEDAMPQRAAHLLRALLLTTSEPLITANTSVAPKKARRIHKSFLGNLRVAKASVEAQLKVCDLDIKAGGTLASIEGTMVGINTRSPSTIACAKAIVAFVAGYQASALAEEAANSMGIFTWLGLRPIMAYLRSLIVCESTVAFLWTAQQFLDVYAQYGHGSSHAPIGAPPILKCVNDLVDEELGRLCDEARDVIEDAEQLAASEEVSVRVIGEAEELLEDMHPVMMGLIRLAVECINVAITSDMPEVPPLMKSIVEDVSQTASDCCDAWAVLLGTLCNSRLSDKVGAACGPHITSLFEEVSALRDTTALDDTCEHLMDTIVSSCEGFIDAVGEASARGAAKGGKRR